MQRERVQALISLSRNTEEADMEIVKFLGNVSTKENKAKILLSEEEADKILSELKPNEKAFFEQLANHIIKSEKECDCQPVSKENSR